MKTNSKKSIMFLLVMAVLCFACSLFMIFPIGNTAYASNTVFEMVDGASVRLRNEENAPMGIRFCVQINATTKSDIVGKEFGFVISRADQFNGVTEYVDMENASKWSYDITSENVNDYFYEYVDESNNTYYRANVVIYKGANDSENDFIQRVYSAVAFYTDGTGYVYAKNIPARSVQQVASTAYFKDSAIFEGVQAAYTAIGTDTVPVLVSNDGDTAYASLEAKIAAGETAGISFALTENVVVEEKIDGVSFADNGYSVYTVDEFYTVNHAVTSVYSTNTAVSLAGKVSAVSGEVTYTVKDASGADVTVTDNSFTPTAAGKYTVTAKVGDYIGKTFTIETAANAYADGLILDGTSAEDVITSITGSGAADAQMNVTFDATKKYDAASNGSYKIEYKLADGVDAVSASVNMNMQISPAFSKAYYQALKADGYTNVAIRIFIEEIICDTSGSKSGLYYITPNTDTSKMMIYADNAVQKEKASTYILWDRADLSLVKGMWAELVLDIDRFINNHGSVMDLLIFKVPADYMPALTMYIDNVYAVKGAVDTALNTTQYVDSGAEIDCATTFASLSNAITSVDLDGNAVTLADNKFAADGYGLYSINAYSRTLYGSVAKNVIVNGSVVSYQAKNFYAKHIINATSAATDYTASVASDKIAVSSGGTGKVSGVSMTTYKIDTLGDLTYYQALQTAGYNYITYEYTLSFTGSLPASIYRYGFVTTDGKHYNAMSSYSFTYKVLEKGLTTENIFDTSSKTSNTGFQSKPSTKTWNGETYIVSIPIQTVIDNYSSTMRILAFYFSAAATDLDYTVTFGNVRATASACVFDAPQAAE